MEVLWVFYSEWPLPAAEGGHALVVEIRLRVWIWRTFMANHLLSSYLSFVTIEASSPTARLGRFARREHLRGDSTLFHNPDSTIAEVRRI